MTITETLRARFRPEWKTRADLAGLDTMLENALSFIPVPTIKISSNSEIAAKKPHWIDFNAGALLDGSRSMDDLADDLFTYVLAIASGRKHTNNEQHGYREIAIWKDGVTL